MTAMVPTDICSLLLVPTADDSNGTNDICSLLLVPTADDSDGTNDICSLFLVPTADYINRPNEKVDTKRIPHFIDLFLCRNTELTRQ